MRRLPVSLVFASLLAHLMTGCTRAPVKPGPQPAATTPAAAQPAAPPTAGAAADASSLSGLIGRLASAGDSRDRVLIIDEIATLGQNATPALAALVKATEDQEERVRWHAVRAIGLIGEDASTAVPVLVKLLADADPIVAAQAAAAIGHVRGDEAADTITADDAARYAAAKEAIVKAVLHADPRVRRAAVRALKQLEPAPAALGPLFGRQLADADPSVVLPALHTLAGMAETSVPVLIEALKDPKSRYWACLGLAEIGAAASPAVAPLTRLAAEGEIDERLQAILALAAIGEPAAATAAPALVGALESPDKSLRFPAAYALGKTRAAAGDLALEKAVADEDKVLAATAAWARAQIHRGEGSFAAEALKRLLEAVAHADPGVREGAVAGLSDLAGQLDAEQRRQLAATFVGLIADPHPEVGLAAGGALIRLGESSLGALRGKLSDPEIRTHVLEILAGIGPAAKPALDDIVKELDDKDADHAGEAAVAIGAIGPEAAAALPALQRIVGDAARPAALRYSAAYALGRIGPAAKAAEPDLRKLTEVEDELMATVAVWAALKVAPEDKTLFERAVPLLRRALRADREMVRLESAVALGDIGPAAATAVPMLELVAEDDPVKDVRLAAAAALKKIRP